jgi:hypothetical protein
MCASSAGLSAVSKDRTDHTFWGQITWAVAYAIQLHPARCASTHPPSRRSIDRTLPLLRRRTYTIALVLAGLKPTTDTAAYSIDSGRRCHMPGYFSAKRASSA